jgi:hypothetical protein
MRDSFAPCRVRLPLYFDQLAEVQNAETSAEVYQRRDCNSTG